MNWWDPWVGQGYNALQLVQERAQSGSPTNLLSDDQFSALMQYIVGANPDDTSMFEEVGGDFSTLEPYDEQSWLAQQSTDFNPDLSGLNIPGAEGVQSGAGFGNFDFSDLFNQDALSEYTFNFDLPELPYEFNFDNFNFDPTALTDINIGSEGWLDDIEMGLPDTSNIPPPDYTNMGFSGSGMDVSGVNIGMQGLNPGDEGYMASDDYYQSIGVYDPSLYGEAIGFNQEAANTFLMENESAYSQNLENLLTGQGSINPQFGSSEMPGNLGFDVSGVPDTILNNIQSMISSGASQGQIQSYLSSVGGQYQGTGELSDFIGGGGIGGTGAKSLFYPGQQTGFAGVGTGIKEQASPMQATLDQLLKTPGRR